MCPRPLECVCHCPAVSFSATTRRIVDAAACQAAWAEGNVACSQWRRRYLSTSVAQAGSIVPTHPAKQPRQVASRRKCLATHLHDNTTLVVRHGRGRPRAMIAVQIATLASAWHIQAHGMERGAGSRGVRIQLVHLRLVHRLLHRSHDTHPCHNQACLQPPQAS